MQKDGEAGTHSKTFYAAVPLNDGPLTPFCWGYRLNPRQLSRNIPSIPEPWDRGSLETCDHRHDPRRTESQWRRMVERDYVVHQQERLGPPRGIVLAWRGILAVLGIELGLDRVSYLAGLWFGVQDGFSGESDAHSRRSDWVAWTFEADACGEIPLRLSMAPPAGCWVCGGDNRFDLKKYQPKVISFEF